MSAIRKRQHRSQPNVVSRLSDHDQCQVAWRHDGTVFQRIVLPPASAEVLPGVRWGYTADFFSPAFWKYHSQVHRDAECFQRHALGRSLVEEVSACLLGGYGMPAELGLAAFARLRDEGLLSGRAKTHELERALARPFRIANTVRRYRFAHQKANYLYGAIKAVHVYVADPRRQTATQPANRDHRDRAEDSFMDSSQSPRIGRCRNSRRAYYPCGCRCRRVP